MQTDMDIEGKKDSKAALEILTLAEAKGIPKREFSKHDLVRVS